MKVPKLMESAIEMAKQGAKIGHSPTALFVNKKGKHILTVLAVENKEFIRFALYALTKAQAAKEVIMITEAFYLKQDNKDKKVKHREDVKLDGPISEHPDRKEAFVVSYFSPKKCLCKMLPFTRKKVRNKEVLKWGKESDVAEGESRFNPYTMTPKEVEEIKMETEMEMMRNNGKKETIPLRFGCRIDIYRHNGKAFFEWRRADDSRGFYLKPQVDDDEFKEMLEEAKEKINELNEMLK